MPFERQTTSLRELMVRGGLVEAPGIADGLGAKLVEQAGFSCVYLSGYQVCASMGHSDVGLVTQDEMVQRTAQVVAVTSLPVIADADNGHGNAINVIRTVREMERVGASAVHLEDQALPKRCAAMAGIELVPLDDMCGKIRAALDARRNPDFMVFARTDALNSTDMADAIRRGQAYRKAGADGVMVQSPRSPEDLLRFRAAVEGPLMLTMGTWDLQLTAAELEAMGYQVLLYPLTIMRRAIVAMSECLVALREGRGLDHRAAALLPMQGFDDLLGLAEIRGLERRYGQG